MSNNNMWRNFRIWASAAQLVIFCFDTHIDKIEKKRIIFMTNLSEN